MARLFAGYVLRLAARRNQHVDGKDDKKKELARLIAGRMSGAQEIDAVILTHAHLDHCGWIPRLVKGGFKGPIYATPATIELCGILLPDSGHLQEEDAAFHNKNKTSKHTPALPLYTFEEAQKCLQYFQPVQPPCSRSLPRPTPRV